MIMVTNKTPYMERCDGQCVVTAKQIRAFHNIPRSGVYLRITDQSLLRRMNLKVHSHKAYTEGKLICGKAAVEGNTQEDVLRRVLYPEAHGNGCKKKKKNILTKATSWSSLYIK